MFWGDRFGKLEDPYGNQWGLLTHKEDVPPKQMAERAKAAGIDKVVFDRGGYVYHGRIAAVADAARDAGLEF